MGYSNFVTYQVGAKWSCTPWDALWTTPSRRSICARPPCLHPAFLDGAIAKIAGLSGGNTSFFSWGGCPGDRVGKQRSKRSRAGSRSVQNPVRGLSYLQQKAPIFFPFLVLGLSLLLRVGYPHMVLMTLPQRRRCLVAAGEPSFCSSVVPESRLDFCDFSRTLPHYTAVYIRLFIGHPENPLPPSFVFFHTLLFNQISDHRPQINYV